MKLFSRIFTVLLLAFFCASPQAEEEREMDKELARLPLEDLQLFVQVFDQIRQAYVEEVDDRTLLENAIEGLLAGLDPHSAYLDKDAFGNLQESTTGEFGGLGIEVGMEEGFIKVIAPIDDTPAHKAGVQAGDLITRLDGEPVQGMGLREAIELMRGPEGTSITLTIMREGVDGPLEIEIERDVIKVQSIRTRMLEEGFGYIRIAQFQGDTGEEFRAGLDKMRQDNGSLRGVVLDLRNNPGGLLPAAVEVADALLDEGVIVSTEGRLPNASTYFHATEGELLPGVPIVVLINSGSASASEIVAGALQDHERAVILGTQTFGKGSVQTVLPLPDGRAVKLTTARYLTPSGRSIQAQGVAPDIVVERAQIKFAPPSRGITEASLRRHLESNGETVDKPEAPDREAVADDYQLYEALSVLKGIAIYNRK